MRCAHCGTPQIGGTTSSRAAQSTRSVVARTPSSGGGRLFRGTAPDSFGSRPDWPPPARRRARLAPAARRRYLSMTPCVDRESSPACARSCVRPRPPGAFTERAPGRGRRSVDGPGACGERGPPLGIHNGDTSPATFNGSSLALRRRLARHAHSEMSGTRPAQRPAHASPPTQRRSDIHCLADCVAREIGAGITAGAR